MGTKIMAGIAAGAVVVPLLVVVPLVAAEAQCAPAGSITGQVSVDVASLAPEQRRNAEVIITVGMKMGFPERGLIVAIATAMQESTLRNLDYGHGTSIGLFQQIDTWGSFAQRHDPVWASTQFYKALRQVKGWQNMPVTVAAQAVQRSAYPDAYAKWEELATKVVRSAATSSPPAGGQHVGFTPTGNGRVFMVGDSLGTGATSAGNFAILEKASEATTWHANSRVSRFTSTGVAILAGGSPSEPAMFTAVDAGDTAITPANAGTWVVQLGTNDMGSSQGAYARQIGKVMRLAGERQVVWLTVYRRGQNPQTVGVNRALRQAAAGHDNLTVLDWAGTAAEHPEWFAPGEVHPSGAGYAAMARMLARVGGGQPGAGPDSVVWPVGSDAQVGATFGQAGSAWSSGHHTGVDFSRPSGYPVKAAHAGQVTETTDSGGAYGSTIVISWQSPDGTPMTTRYAHLSVRLAQRAGATVEAGERIGRVGWSGNVIPRSPAGAHLHFELTADGTQIDPMPWLRDGGTDVAGTDPAPTAGCPAGYTSLGDITDVPGSAFSDAPVPTNWSGRSVEQILRIYKANPGGLPGNTIFNHCLWYAQEITGGRHFGDHAMDVWAQLPDNKRHADRNPVPGAILLYSGGDYGHTVVYLGGGNVLSTDMTPDGDFKPGVWNIAPADYTETKWGKTYLGWYEPNL